MPELLLLMLLLLLLLLLLLGRCHVDIWGVCRLAGCSASPPLGVCGNWEATRSGIGSGLNSAGAAGMPMRRRSRRGASAISADGLDG